MERGKAVPRPKSGNQPTAKSEQARLLWGSGGGRHTPTLSEWDPKPDPFVQAILEVLSSGATLVLRPGSGGRSFGVAIWEGDDRHPPRWLYDNDEVDDWAMWVLDQVAVNKGQAAD